jgi:hypothetical protein
MIAWDYNRVTGRAASDTRVSNYWTDSIVSQLIARPMYTTSTLLLEDGGGSTSALLSAYTTNADTLENSLGAFYILKEGDTFHLWVSSRVRTGSLGNATSKEEWFESQDGLVWRNRTDTNLAWSGTPYKYLWGLRQVRKNGGVYEGWEQYSYEWSEGWGLAVRYLTSIDGLTWSVVNQPALIGAWFASVAKDGTTYHMWENPHADFGLYTGSRALRHRASANPGSGWGDWQTGGSVVKVDGTKEVMEHSRVRRLADGTYQLFYIEGSQLGVATSSDGVNFASQVANLLDVFQVVPTSAVDAWFDFQVVDVDGEDWFYFVYCLGYDPSSHYCEDSRIAVARPEWRVYLPQVAARFTDGFPVHIGNAIPVRPVVEQGEIFYARSLAITGPLPPSGRFYFSSQPDRVAEALVDDKLAVLLGGDEVFVYNFSTSGHPVPAVVEVPRPVLQQMAGKTVLIEYRDVYASVVEASQMWLIWVP